MEGPMREQRYGLYVPKLEILWVVEGVLVKAEMLIKRMLIILPLISQHMKKCFCYKFKFSQYWAYLEPTVTRGVSHVQMRF